jgi:hypothetical protein
MTAVTLYRHVMWLTDFVSGDRLIVLLEVGVYLDMSSR